MRGRKVQPSTEADLDRVFATIRASLDRSGASPTLAEIAHETGLSLPVATKRVRLLEKRGRIQREYGKSRSIRIPANG